MENEDKRSFDHVLRKIINNQIDTKQPIYVIATYWCGRFTKIEDTFTTDGDNDLDEIKKIFREKYAWRKNTMGVTELSHKLIRIDISEVLGVHGEEVKL